MMFAQKGLFGSETEKSHLHVRPWLLLRYQTFPHGGRQTHRQTDTQTDRQTETNIAYQSQVKKDAKNFKINEVILR